MCSIASDKCKLSCLKPVQSVQAMELSTNSNHEYWHSYTLTYTCERSFTPEHILARKITKNRNKSHAATHAVHMGEKNP